MTSRMITIKIMIRDTHTKQGKTKIKLDLRDQLENCVRETSGGVGKTDSNMRLLETDGAPN